MKNFIQEFTKFSQSQKYNAKYNVYTWLEKVQECIACAEERACLYSLKRPRKPFSNKERV